MIKGIFKQMWAQRSSNSWLFVELVVIFVVVWLVIDPLYVLQYEKSIPMGFNYENIYKINVNMLPNTAPEYSEDDDTSEKLMEDIKRMGNIIRTYPGVEAVAIQDGGHVLGDSYYGISVWAEGDSIAANPQMMSYLKGWDYWEVYRYTSITDDKWETLAEIELPLSDVIITKDLDAKLFEKLSKEDPFYKKVIKHSKEASEPTSPVAEVINYVKRHSYSQPGPILFEAVDEIEVDDIRWGAVNIVIRVQDGTSEYKFIEEFKRDMAPELRMRNLRMGDISSFNTIKAINEKKSGGSTVRTQMILTVFFLMIVFLGVISSFWLKTETRRGEIGLRMALGANKGKIIKRLVLEGWVMVFVSSVVGLIIQLNIVYFKGLTRNSFTTIPEAWPVNNPIAHFTIVTLIVFALLILTITIGSLFPAYKAANTNPVDALRDE